ncbi:hypothetical protein CCP4SC76_7110005 [Gammaproteobacteria bacterium]
MSSFASIKTFHYRGAEWLPIGSPVFAWYLLA